MNDCVSSEPRHFRLARAADRMQRDAGRRGRRPALLWEENDLQPADATWLWIEHEVRMKNIFGSCNETSSHETIAAVMTLAAHADRI